VQLDTLDAGSLLLIHRIPHGGQGGAQLLLSLQFVLGQRLPVLDFVLFRVEALSEFGARIRPANHSPIVGRQDIGGPAPIASLARGRFGLVFSHFYVTSVYKNVAVVFFGFLLFQVLHMRCTPTLPKVPAILHLVIVGFSSICNYKFGYSKSMQSK